MGIDYIIDLSCAAKEALGTGGIVSLLKNRARANMVLQVARGGGDERPPSEIAFEVHVIGPGGEPEPREVNVQTLLDDAAVLDQHHGGCEVCTANPSGAPYGCVGSINYPIERATEAWLLARLPGEIESTAGQLLSRAIADFGWEDGQAAAMRGQGDMFFESTELLRRDWDDGELMIDSNQVHNMLFGVGHLGSAHCRMLALFFGMVPAQIDLGELMDLPADRLIEMALAAELDSGGSDQIGLLDRALRSMAIAGALDCDLLIDG